MHAYHDIIIKPFPLQFCRYQGTMDSKAVETTTA